MFKSIVMFGCLVILAGCSTTPVKIPSYQWPNSAAGELARVSLQNSLSYLKSERQYKRTVRDNSVKSKLIDTFSVGVGWSFSQGELVPSVRVNLLRVLNRNDDMPYNTKAIIYAKKQHLFRIKKMISELIIEKGRKKNKHQRLIAYKNTTEQKELILSQHQQQYTEAKIRFDLKLDELVFYTDVDKQGIHRILGHYEIYL